jgi:hypothetical protein
MNRGSREPGIWVSVFGSCCVCGAQRIPPGVVGWMRQRNPQGMHAAWETTRRETSESKRRAFGAKRTNKHHRLKRAHHFLLNAVCTNAPRFVARKTRTVAAEIQANSHGCFVSQLDPEAGLGCHPFHLTLMGGLQTYSDQEVHTALSLSPLVASGTLPLTVNPEVVRWNLTSGSLQMLVRCDQLPTTSYDTCDQRGAPMGP